jgi:hypothetical protein
MNIDSRPHSLWFCLLTSCFARSLEEQTRERDDDEIRHLALRTRTRRCERPLLTLPPDLLPPTSRDRYSVPFSSSSNFYLWMAQEREEKHRLYSTSLDTTLRREDRKFILMKFQSWPFIFLVREKKKSVTNTYFVSLKSSTGEVTSSAGDSRSWFLTAKGISFSRYTVLYWLQGPSTVCGIPYVEVQYPDLMLALWRPTSAQLHTKVELVLHTKQII